MSLPRRIILICSAAAAAAVSVSLAPGSLGPARSGADTPSLSQLNGQLGHEQARQQSLSSSNASLGHLITGLDGQIQLVQNREAAFKPTSNESASCWPNFAPS